MGVERRFRPFGRECLKTAVFGRYTRIEPLAVRSVTFGGNPLLCRQASALLAYRRRLAAFRFIMKRVTDRATGEATKMDE